MSKAKLLKIVNTCLILSALIQMTGGVLLFFSVSFPSIHEIHNYNGLVMTGLIVVHFILNWSWVKNTFFAKKNPPAKAK